MNTWRDIKEAPLNQAVFATDGDMVFFGRFAMTADRKCMFEGQDIEEACNYGIDPACLTGWQPIPDTWKPEKSADEMFRELGWELDMPAYNGLPRKYVNRHKWKIEFLHKDGTVEIGSIYGTFVLNEKTFLAIAQLIREMEADNG